MPRVCTICEHPKIEEINKALLETQNITKIAERFGVNYYALYRHKDHIPIILTRAQEAQEAAKADTLLDQVADLRDKALSILATAEQAGDLRTALQGIKEARACLELLAKLQGELHEQATVNVLISPKWVSLRTVILQTLEPYPQAKLALAQALEEVEGGRWLMTLRWP